MRAARIIVWTAAAVFAQCVSGAEPTIHEFVKTAVEAKEVRKTDMLGFGIVHTAYRDSPRDGAVLIGFDVALRHSGDQTDIVALRPVYLTPRGEVVGNAAGSFSTTRDHKISRTVRVAGKPGYAVGRVALVTGLQIHAMSVTFMRIKGPRLDQKDSYRSPWFGSRGGSEDGKTLTSRGGPVVGVFGNVSGPRVIGLGLIVADPPVVDEDEAPPEPAAAPTPASSPAPVSVEEPEAAAPPPAAGSAWVAFAVGGTVIAIVGLGLMLVVNRKANTPSQPPKTKPRPAASRPKPTAGADDAIPLVYPADSDEPAASSPLLAPPPRPVASPPATAAAPPAPAAPPALAPPGQLGAIDYEGDAVAPADKQATLAAFALGVVFVMLAFATAFLSLNVVRDRVLVPGILGAIGVVSLGGGVFCLLRMRKHITVYENGVRYDDGRRQEMLFWTDVVAVRDFSVRLMMNGRFQHTTRTVTVRGRDGRKIEFSGDAQNNGGLADAVLQRAYDHITPRVLHQLAGGQTVDLGPLEVSNGGIGTRLGTVPWAQVGDVQVENGHVVIYQGRSVTPWLRVSLGDIDNYQLLFALLDHFGGRRTP